MEFIYNDTEKDLLILTADGGLNSQTAPEFLDQLQALIDAGVTHLIVDCAHLDYISSYGVGVLVRLHTRLARRGGDVKIAAPKSLVLGALTTLRMGELFGIYPDVNAARLAFRAKTTG